jgi:hypothetical protein
MTGGPVSPSIALPSNRRPAHDCASCMPLALATALPTPPHQTHLPVTHPSHGGRVVDRCAPLASSPRPLPSIASTGSRSGHRVEALLHGCSRPWSSISTTSKRSTSMVTASSPQHGPPRLPRSTHASSGTAPCTEVYIVVRHLYATFFYSHIPFHFLSASTKPNSTREIAPKFQIKSSNPSQENTTQQHGDPTRFGMERVFSVEEIPNPY